MPTALSSTDAVAGPGRRPERLRPVRDVWHLLRFRAAAVRRRTAFWWALALLVGVSVTVAVVPAYVPATDEQRLEFAVLLPSGMAGILLIAVISAVASGGGRELIAKEQAVAYPVSPITDHLGALVLAPLNIAWLIQAWALLGGTAYALGPDYLVTAQVVMVLWLALATALAQVIAWSVEAVRRRPHGLVTVRMVVVGLAGLAVAVQVAGRTTELLDQVPTRRLVFRAVEGIGWPWAQAVAFELIALMLAVVIGGFPARWAARRLPRDELRVETDSRTPRPMPWSDLTALLRIDRASVWRAVPMRRGMAVLAVGPGLVAVMGDLPWATITVLPGLVVSGGALLFGVNIWCVDGRGLLWRQNLPVDPGLVFTARAVVLAEFLGLASLVTILLASLRAGVPSSAELTAIVCTVVVVTVQVVAAAMRWSDQRPYSVDLRSARATPAPPVVMVGYSARLALSTTMTGLMFSLLARAPDPSVSLLFALPCVAWSTVRLLRSRRRWLDPVARARVVVAVSA